MSRWEGRIGHKLGIRAHESSRGATSDGCDRIDAVRGGPERGLERDHHELGALSATALLATKPQPSRRAARRRVELLPTLSNLRSGFSTTSVEGEENVLVGIFHKSSAHARGTQVGPQRRLPVSFDCDKH